MPEQRSTGALAAYSLLLRLLLPVFFMRWWWRGRREPAYAQHWNERLGLTDGWRRPDRSGRLWLHAVSLGETRAAEPLIAELRARRPDVSLLLTHGTATGRAAGAGLLHGGDAQTWLPIDTPGAARRFFDAHRPAAGVLMETEIWPNLLHAAQAAAVPMVLANGRLSERSQRKGLRVRALMQPAVAVFSRVLAQSEADARRMQVFGPFRDGVLQVVGNLKFDVRPRPDLLARGRQWREQLQRSVVLAAITREGEEAVLLAEWKQLRAPRPLLVLVPRHPQRFDEVGTLIADSGLFGLRRSAWTERSPIEARAADVWLGDSVGEMPLYYALADIALLGGSFAPLGGHNLIEAAACGCPLLMGPSTFNFAQAADWALAAGAAERCDDLPHAVGRAVDLCGDAALVGWSQRALAFAAQHRGAASRTAQAVLDCLPPSKAEG